MHELNISGFSSALAIDSFDIISMKTNLELLSIAEKYSSPVRAPVQITCKFDTTIVANLKFKKIYINTERHHARKQVSIY